MLALLLSQLAMGQASADSPALTPALTVGVVELVGVAAPPVHLGVYGMVSLDLLIPLSDKWMLIPSNGFEFAPENGHWGGFSFLILDTPIAEFGDTLLTLEPQVGLIHDAAPTGSGFDHAFFPTVGLGAAFNTPYASWVPTLTTSVGLKGEGVSQGFLLLFSVPID